MKIEVYASVVLGNEFQGMSPVLKADWKKYKLILFNLVQNSVKYNNYKGAILIIIRLHNPIANN